MGTLLTIYNNSYAHRYCEDNSKPYTLLILNGDVDVNGIVDITDVILLKRHLIAGNEKQVEINIQNIKTPMKIGDINADDKIDITDIILLKRHLIAGNRTNWILTGDNLESADMNENGKVDISDLLLLKREVAQNI